MQQRSDRLYWRIVPVGFATAFLSGAGLALLLAAVAVRGEAGEGGILARSVALFGLGGLILAAVLWLPLLVLWNVLVLRLRRRFALRPLATAVSGGMALCLTLAATLVFAAGVFAQGKTALLFLGWGFGTALLAAGLTWCSFGRSAGLVA